MVFNEKSTKNRKLQGIKLRGLRRNQISTPYFIYQIVRSNRIKIIRNFENETPTHISATYAFSKIRKKFQNRISREFDQKFGIPRISMIY